MSQVGNNQDLGGEYMVQDRDHMVESDQSTAKAPRGKGRQVDQSQTEGRQQGGDHDTASQQGTARRRQSR